MRSSPSLGPLPGGALCRSHHFWFVRHGFLRRCASRACRFSSVPIRSSAFRRSPKSTRRITSRQSGDRNGFFCHQDEAFHPERKALESLDGIRRTLGESTSLTSTKKPGKVLSRQVPPTSPVFL